MEQHFHFYNFVFAVPMAGALHYATVMRGLEAIEITKPTLDAVAQQAKVPEGSFLFSLAYLGYMTPERFNPPPVQPNNGANTGIDAAYAEGFQAGNSPETSEGNPYREGTERASRWDHGFRDGAASKQAAPTVQ